MVYARPHPMPRASQVSHALLEGERYLDASVGAQDERLAMAPIAQRVKVSGAHAATALTSNSRSAYPF